MKNLGYAICLALCTTSAAQAQGSLTCGAAENNWHLFETLKRHFLEGDYRAFLTESGPMLAHEIENYDAYFGGLEQHFPDGFSMCQTVLVRAEPPNFRQEIVMFLHEEMRGPMTLLLTGVRIRGEAQLVYFNYNSSVTAVLDELR